MSETPHTLSLLLDPASGLAPDSIDLDMQDAVGMTALMWAVFYMRQANVEVLLHAGASTRLCDHNQKTALHWTATNTDRGCAASLLHWDSQLADLADAEGRTVVHLVTAEQNRLLLETLLRLGAHPSVPDSTGRTPLHWAAAVGNPDLLAVLLEFRADPSIQDLDG